jgi:hypothetical protein
MGTTETIALRVGAVLSEADTGGDRFVHTEKRFFSHGSNRAKKKR